MHVCMYVALSTWQSGWVGNQPRVGPRFDTSCSPDSTSAVCDAAADTLYGPNPCGWCDEMISELGGRLPSTHDSRQPLLCAARVYVVAHHLLKWYLGALKPEVLTEPHSSTSVVVVFNQSDVGQTEPQLSARGYLRS